jgi:hypothetical protein
MELAPRVCGNLIMKGPKFKYWDATEQNLGKIWYEISEQ